LLNSKIDYEFRTTVVPALLNKEDIVTLAAQIKGAKKYALQQFIPQKTLNKDYEKVKPYSKEELEQIKKEVESYFEFCELRGI